MDTYVDIFCRDNGKTGRREHGRRKPKYMQQSRDRTDKAQVHKPKPTTPVLDRRADTTREGREGEEKRKTPGPATKHTPGGKDEARGQREPKPQPRGKSRQGGREAPKPGARPTGAPSCGQHYGCTAHGPPSAQGNCTCDARRGATQIRGKGTCKAFPKPPRGTSL